MLLYLVYDKKNNTTTAPALAQDLNEVKAALREVNPENSNDLVIHELCYLSSFLDLFFLDLDQNKQLPSYVLSNIRSAEVTPSATHQAESAVVIPPEDYELSN